MEAAPVWFNSDLLNAMAQATNAVAVGDTATGTYTHYRFTFTQRRGSEDLQLGGVRLISADKNDIEVDEISNPGGRSPEHEAASKLVDNADLQQKWLDLEFTRHGQSVLVLKLAQPRDKPAAGYQFFTANDCPQRDPTAWFVEAKRGDVWIRVDEREFHASTITKDRNTSMGEFLFGSGRYTHYRFTFTQRRGNGDTCVQLSRVRLISGEQKDIEVDEFSNPGGRSPEHERASKLIDNADLKQKWLDLEFTRHGQSVLVLKLAQPMDKVATGYEFFTANDCPHRDPTAWFVEAKRGDVWTELDSREFTTSALTNTRHTSMGKFWIGASGPSGNVLVTQYKFIFTSRRANSDANLQLGGIVLLPHHSQDPITIADISNPGGRSPYNETPRMLLGNDELRHKWLDSNFRNNGRSELVIQLASPSELCLGYELFTANDAPERDPLGWTVQVQKRGHWIEVDRRLLQPSQVPIERRYTMGQFIFGVADVREEKAPEIEEAATFISPPALRRAKSNIVSDHWAAVNRTMCPEYASIMDQICLKETFLKGSRLHAALDSLRSELKKTSTDFADVLRRCLARAYPGQRPEHARCMLGNYPLLRNITTVHGQLGSWRQPFVGAALRILHDGDTADGLVGILGLLARGGSECQARKNMAFATLISRAAEVLGRANDTPDEAKQDITSEDKAERARALLLEFVTAYIDDLKMKAFRSAFLEPTRLVFHLTGNSLRDDVEVHGSNLYATVLLATLGIRLPYVPLMRDDPKGFCEFLSAESLAPQFEDMLNAQSVGRDFLQYPKSKEAKLRGGYPRVNSLIFPGSTPLIIANAAIDPSPAKAQQRSQMAQYLQRFAHFFTPKMFLERLCISLFAEIEEELQIAFKAWGKGGDADVKEWLYHEEDFTFLQDRALELFQHLGICREIRIQEVSSPPPKATCLSS